MYKRLNWLVCLMILVMLTLLYRVFVLVTPSEEGIENIRIQMIDQAVLFEREIDNLRMQMIDQAALFEKGIDNLRIQMIDQAAQDNITVEKEADNSEIWQLLASPEIQVWYLLTLTDIEFAAYTVTGPEDEQLNFLFQQQLLANVEIATKMRDELREFKEQEQIAAEAYQRLLKPRKPEPPIEKMNPSDHSDREDICGAWAAAQMLVKNHLVSPSTASFGKWYEQSCSKVVTPLGNYRYRVKAFVDSQNSFGATIRTHFTMEVEKYRGQWLQMTWSDDG